MLSPEVLVNITKSVETDFVIDYVMVSIHTLISEGAPAEQ